MIDDGWQHWNTEFSNYDLDIHGAKCMETFCGNVYIEIRILGVD